jgi:hypothetical protein
MKPILSITSVITVFALAVSFSCATTKKGVKFTSRPIPARSNIAVIIDSPNNIKNIVLGKFLLKGFNVKAVNASDTYTLSDIYDIKDFKKVSNVVPDNNSIMSLEKTYSNIFKLHIYNYELNKAEMLDEIKKKWGVSYLIILDLKDWQSVSWGRAIDLNTLELMWVENYPTRYTDNVETILDYFIESMQTR